MIDKWLEIHRQLLAGNYDDWWPRHQDIRTGNPEFMDRFSATPTFGKPVWDGEAEPITLLVNADFGMGDTIHFYRFVWMAKLRVAKVILRCDEDFKTLFHDVEVVGKDEPLPEFDKIIHMMALPRVLGVKKADIESDRYIRPNQEDPMDWALDSTISKIRFYKIGVCWQGNPFNPRDGLRSIPEEKVKRFIWGFDHGMRFFSLNKIGPVPESFFDMKPYMGNWNQTAHLIDRMDMVVTVDTAVAHLAGAMSRPTMLVVPEESPDWRWGTEGDKTVWYESVKLYRNNNWDDTIDRIVSDLK